MITQPSPGGADSVGDAPSGATGHVADQADQTPDAWRAFALVVLLGGLAAGWRATSGRRASVPIALAAAVVAGAVIPVARASRRPPIARGAGPLDPAAQPPTFSIVVAGRDEANVLPHLVADLAAQDWREPDGTPRFELVVVDDRSSDGTADAVGAAAAQAGIGAVTRVVRRVGQHLPDGKGAALTAAQPDACHGEYVVVLDADARVAPGFLRILAGYVAAGAAALTVRRRILDAGHSVLTRVQADEQTLDGELQRGRWAMGGCSEFRGNGIVIRRELLAGLGGWRADALTEDLDLSSRLAAERGITVAWAIDAEVWEEPVHSWSGLWRQRLRWAEGAVRRLCEHGPAVLRSERLAPVARADFALYTGQLLAPPLILGAVAGAVRRRPETAVILVGTYLAIGGGLAYDALRWETDASGCPLPPGDRLMRSIRSALFNSIWLGAIPGALCRLAVRRGPVQYDKMPHRGSISAAQPPGPGAKVEASGHDADRPTARPTAG